MGLCLSGLVWSYNWNGLSVYPSLCMLWHAIASITGYGLLQFSICYGIAVLCICYGMYSIYTIFPIINQSENKNRFCVGYCIFVWTTIRNPALVLVAAELMLIRSFPGLSMHHKIRSYIVSLFASCVFVWKKYDSINTNFMMVLSLGYSCSILWVTVKVLSCKK